MRGLTLHVWPCRQFKRTAGNCSPIHPTIRIWPPQTTTCSGPWKITWEVTTTGLTRQSRKSCEAGCEELERTYTVEAFLRFCNVGRNAEIWVDMWRFCRRVTRQLDVTDNFCFCRINVLITFGTLVVYSTYMRARAHTHTMWEYSEAVIKSTFQRCL
jgi:hypothetical protein